MSFLYPRFVSIHRPNNTAPLAGDAGYLGVSRAAETIIVEGLAASIQPLADLSAPLAHVPADTIGRTSWRIYVRRAPGQQLPEIYARDIVVDDHGERYQVTAAYHEMLGYQLRVERLIA